MAINREILMTHMQTLHQVNAPRSILTGMKRSPRLKLMGQ